jgi:hypothetical protein
MSGWRCKRVVLRQEGSQLLADTKSLSPELCGTNFAKERELRKSRAQPSSLFRDSILTATKTPTIILEIVGRFESIKFRSCYSAL